MKLHSKDFRVKEGDGVSLKKWPTRVPPFYETKGDYQEILAHDIDEMRALQGLLYAHNRYSLLLIFQAMDAAGKDGAIKHVMSGINPQGCQVSSFKQPSAEELEHDFLWRTTRSLPERGKIGIFNRSYYEEVLVARVHPEILRHEGLPEEFLGKEGLWKGRYRSIVEYEKHLHENGTRVLKIFLHLSKEEQRKRFLARLEDPQKNWKFSMSDIQERKYWDQYWSAYEDCLTETTTERAPWHIVPADDKYNSRLVISHLILHCLKDLKMEYPKPDEDRKKEWEAIRRALENEK